jgi:hypothetical protein
MATVNWLNSKFNDSGKPSLIKVFYEVNKSADGTTAEMKTLDAYIAGLQAAGIMTGYPADAWNVYVKQFGIDRAWIIPKARTDNPGKCQANPNGTAAAKAPTTGSIQSNQPVAKKADATAPATPADPWTSRPATDDEWLNMVSTMQDNEAKGLRTKFSWSADGTTKLVSTRPL